MPRSRKLLDLLVVQETDWLQRGPHQQHHILERLSERGHKIVVVDFEILYNPWPRGPLIVRRREWPSVSRTVPKAKVHVIRPSTVGIPILARSFSMVTFYRELSALARRLRPNLILDYAISTGLPALAIARRFNIPFAMHVLDALHTLVPSKVLHPIARAIERTLLRSADHSVYINQELQDYGVKMGAHKERAHTIGTGVDLDTFRPDIEAASLRRELGFSQNDLVLLFVGWLYEFTGIDTIMHTMLKLPPHVKLLVVGSGEAETKLRRLQQSLDLGERVVFAGKQPYDLIPKFIAAADVGLMYSNINDVTRHILPVKTYEYLASGKPVLASQLPGVMREVPPGNGVLYAPQDQLGTIIKQLLNKEMRLMEGARGRAFTEVHCDWESLTDDFEQLMVTAATY